MSLRSPEDEKADFEAEVQKWMHWKGTPPFVSSPAWEEAQRRLTGLPVGVGKEGEGIPPGMTYDEWKKKYAPHDSGHDYDLKGAYKAGIVPGPDGHFPDTYKLPNHPTFSIESKYYKPGMPAGRWEGTGASARYVPMTAEEAAKFFKRYPNKEADTGGAKVPY